MRKLTSLLSAATCLALISSPALSKNAPTLQIENFIGTVDITTGNYDKITVTDADGVPIDATRGKVFIDGGYKVNNANCRTKRSSVDISLGRWKYKKKNGGYKNISEYPKLKITAPDTVHLIIDQSVIFGYVENIGSGDIQIRSCGDIDFADIKGNLDLRISGSGDVNIGDAGASELHISGAGDLETGDLASAIIHISGSGDIETGDILGHAEIEASGAGDLEIGRILGGLEFEGSGTTDFEAEFVGGDSLHIQSSGNGDINIAGGDVRELDISASGASDVTYLGRSVNAEAHASGASDVTLHQPSGELRTSDSGAGDVHVRH